MQTVKQLRLRVMQMITYETTWRALMCAAHHLVARHGALVAREAVALRDAARELDERAVRHEAQARPLVCLLPFSFPGLRAAFSDLPFALGSASFCRRPCAG